MRFFPKLVAILLIGACASNPPPEPVSVTVVDDFVATAELEQTDRVDRLTPVDKWYALNDRYVALRNIDGDFLFHLQRGCDDMERQHYIEVTGTIRRSIQLPWSRFSDCRIKAIYKLTDIEAQELYGMSSIPLVMKRADSEDQ